MALQPHILHHPQVARPLHATTHPSPHGQYKWPTLSPRPLAYAQSEGECCKNRGQAFFFFFFFEFNFIVPSD